MLRLLLRLLCQPEKNKRVCGSMASRFFFHPLSLSITYPGFSKQRGQCEQQDNRCCEQDEEQYTHFINLPIKENLDYFQLLVIIDNIRVSGGGH